MNWEQIQGNYNQMKGHLKTQWGRLTDQDLAEIDGERHRLVGKIQELYGVSREAAEKQVERMKS